MRIDDIKSPQDILEFMKSNIKYGWPNGGTVLGATVTYER